MTEQRIKNEWGKILPKVKSLAEKQKKVQQTEREGDAMGEVPVEEGAVLIASWEHAKDLNVRSTVYRRLDEIANLVRKRLSQTCGETLVDDLTQVDGQMVLRAVNSTLYELLGFSGNVSDYMRPCNRYPPAHHFSVRGTF